MSVERSELNVERSAPQGAVFLSYAREDTDAAKRIAEALRGFGVEVWFDQSELRGGDQWDAKIRGQIKACALFLPIVSATTQARDEGYFRLEWKLADDRSHLMAQGKAFIVPVVIDDTPDSGTAVPDSFTRAQWTRLAGGAPTPQFVEQVKRLLESPRKPALKPDLPRPPTLPPEFRQSTQAKAGSGDPALQKKPSIARWSIGAVVAVVAGVSAALLVTRKPAPPAAPAAQTHSPSLSPSTPPATPAAISAQSVAVLAFANLSDDKGSEYFSDGISEEVLNVLAKVPGLKVSARTSAFYFKGKNVPIPEIARQLGVAYVVEGSVQRAGERVKITAQLIKAADGFHVWSDTFTRDAKDVFAVQEEIAGRIAKELSLKLGVSSAAATAAVNPQAFELYLQGRQAWNLRTDEGYARAEELLNRALTLEPDFARAVSALADVWLVRGSSHGDIGRFGQRDSPEMKRILAQIERALALDPASAEAHASLGQARQMNWQLPESARALRQAIALNPNYATAHQWLGRTLLNDGYYDEGLAALRHAADLDPLSTRILDNYAIALRIFGRYTEALTADERALALQPGNVQAGVWRVLDLSGLGRHEEAVAQARKMAPLARGGFERFLIGVLVKAGARTEAEALLRAISADRVSQTFRGLAALGRQKEALDTLNPAMLGMSDIGDFLVSTDFDPVRENPQFVQLLATLGLTEAHARAQAWRAAHPPRSK